MTSLANQLSRLAVPHTDLTAGVDKKRASLLYDPKEAATFDKEHFFNHGMFITYFPSFLYFMLMVC